MAYYAVYFYYYPGNFQSDSSSTMQDAAVIYSALPEHPADYLRMVFGFHSNEVTDPLYEPYFKHIGKWGKADVTTEFFLNDNRTSIRINALIMLLSFGSYAVHAVFMLILSFIGQLAFYKTFKPYFANKEKWLAVIVFLAPSVIFWTSGVLKEPIVLSLMGLFLYAFFKLFVNRNFQLKYWLLLCFTVLMFCILKPYILIMLVFPLIIFIITQRLTIKRIGLFYISSLVMIYTLLILGLKFVFHKDVINTIVVRQNDFVSLSKGGAFFLNDKNYLRIEYGDTAYYHLTDSSKNLYRIAPHARLMYWKLDHLQDTIYVTDNKDTSLYQMLWVNAPAGSSISDKRLQYSFKSFAEILPQSFFNVLARPFFVDSRSMLELLASLENLCFLVFFTFTFVYRKRHLTDKNLLWFCIMVVLLSYLLIGITTTVMGAIVRYKIPFIPFLLMIPLLYMDENRLAKIPFLRRLTDNKS